MTLVKRTSRESAPDGNLSVIKAVSLSPTQRVMANIATEPVRRRDFVHRINAVGVMDYAEPYQAKVTARFRGRIEKLHVNYTGEVVRKGQPLFEMYSPDLSAAERDYALAYAAVASTPQSVAPGKNAETSDLLSAARERLRVHYGMTSSQIEAITSTEPTSSTVTFYAPIQGTVTLKEVQEGQYVDEGTLLYQLADDAKLWAYLDIYEKDMRFVQRGLKVALTTDAYPGESFSGRVAFIDPALDPQTRTLRVRVELNNAGGKLKPQMYVRAETQIPISNSLVVPSSALLSTGKRDVVWVEVQPNTFEPREVHVGLTDASGVQILHGLQEGEMIAISGGFLIDSESQLRQPVEGQSGSQKGHVHD
jgi:Cu(I)/Ag(I) efflux system membrane fusion protein